MIFCSYECVRIVLGGFILFRYAKFVAPLKDILPDETHVGAGLPARMGCAKTTGH